MQFNNHKNLIGQHAYLSASSYHWLNYDNDKFALVYKNQLAKARGTALHDLAAKMISLKVKLPRAKKTLNLYVNDAIGFNMVPEQPLYYSPNCFGTADSIYFDERKRLLRIHDLKTGTSPAKMDQLMIYAALFCLEYDIRPCDISYELRIYQNNGIEIMTPDGSEVSHIVDRIIICDKLINQLKLEENGIEYID